MNHFPKILLAIALTAVPAASAAAQSAWLVESQGEVGVTGPSGEIPVKVPLEVPQGSVIRTGSGGTALVMLGDGSKVQIRSGSSFSYPKTGADETVLSLLKGALTLWARHQVNHRLSIRVPGAVAAVRGTVTGAETNGLNSSFDLFQGQLEILDSFGGGTFLDAGQRALIGQRGFSGTQFFSSAGVPPEPVGFLPPSAGAPPNPPLPKKKDDKKTQIPPPNTIPMNGDGSLPPQPPPPPSQSKAVVSPSAP